MVKEYEDIHIKTMLYKGKYVTFFLLSLVRRYTCSTVRNVYVCMYVCMYVCPEHLVVTFGGTFAFVIKIHPFVWAVALSHTYTHTYIRYIHTYIHTHPPTYIHTYIHT